MKNKSRLILILFALFSQSTLVISQTANHIDQGTAEKVAFNYCLQLKERYFKADDIVLSLAESKVYNNALVYYAFNINQDQGFIIISADKNSPPVLCFQPGLAYENDPAKRDPSFNDWLEAFMIQIESSITKKITSDRWQKLWDAYTVKGLQDSENLELKLTTRWNQSFNYYAPEALLAGCVAVAMAQVINYHQWPVNGTGFKQYTDLPNDPVQWPDRFNCGYYESSYGTFNTLTGNHTGVYDYTKMKNNDRDEISRLMFNAAVSVEMDWTGCGSWANTPVVVEPALETYFGYSTDAQYISIDDYTESGWNSILIEQIRNERPFIYRGLKYTTGWSGHAWVGLGYLTINGETQYLFNLGWGDEAGYLTLMETGFTINQGAVINIFPVSQPDLLVTTASVTENPVISGDPFTLNYSAENQGPIGAASTTIACYLSSDQTLDQGDTPIATAPLPSLGIDQTENGSLEVILSSEFSGSYYILIETDPEHYVHESDEANNMYVIPVTIQGSVPAYPFKSASGGSWEDPSTWEFDDGSGWRAATSYPSASSGQITIQSGHNIVINNSKPLDEVTVEQNAKVTVSSGNTVTIAGGPEEKDFRVYGTLENLGTISTTGVLAFEDGSVYLHSRDGGSIPVAEWETGSNCRITGIVASAPGITSGTQFENFIWDCTLQAADISLSGRLNSVKGDFEILSTNNVTYNNNALLLGLGESGNITIEGNFFLKGNSTLVIAPGSAQREMTVYKNFSIVDSNCKLYLGSTNPATLKVAGDFSHLSGSITGPGSIFFIGNEMQMYSSVAPHADIVNYTVNNGAFLQMGTAENYSRIGGNGTFTLSAGGTLGITSANGITTSGSSGNIQITTRVYNSGANYIYNGNGAQASGNGLPRTVSSIKLAGATDFTFTNGITKSDPFKTNSGFTVEAGAKVTITPQQAVTIGANLVNDGILNLEADGTGLASLMINGSYSGAGNVKSEIWMTGGEAGTGMWRWHYFAVPSQQSSQSLAALYGNNIMKYDDASGLTSKEKGWAWYDGYDEISGDTHPENGFSDLIVKEGYAFYHNSSSTPLTMEINGTSLISSMGIKNLKHEMYGWNLIGNSLSCGLNWDNVSFSGDVDQTVFFLKDFVEYYYIKDGPGSPLGENDGHIPPYQGFFVNANAPGALIDFSNAREHNSTVYYKKGESRDDTKRRNFPIIRLTFGNNDLTDETVLWFKNEATYDHDSRFDAEKWYSEGNRPQFYSSYAGKDYAINGIPFPESTVKIPLGYYAPADGKYTIGRLQLENAGNYLIYLEDLDQNVKIRLDQTEKYSFATGQGSFTDRFIISISSLSENPEELGKEQFKLYAYNEMINILPLTSEWEEQQATLRVFDLTGNTLIINNNIEFRKGSLLQLPLSNFRKGIYLVEIRTKKLKYTGKVPLK